jgi:hypothetical protein
VGTSARTHSVSSNSVKGACGVADTTILSIISLTPPSSARTCVELFSGDWGAACPRATTGSAMHTTASNIEARKRQGTSSVARQFAQNELSPKRGILLAETYLMCSTSEQSGGAEPCFLNWVSGKPSMQVLGRTFPIGVITRSASCPEEANTLEKSSCNGRPAPKISVMQQRRIRE